MDLIELLRKYTWVPIVVALVVSPLLAGLAARSARVDRVAYRAGIRPAIIASVVIAVIAGVLVTTTLDQATSFGFAGSIDVGLAQAAIYGAAAGLALGLVLLDCSLGALAAGLLLRGGRGWAAIAWVAGPALAVVIAVGPAFLLNMLEERARVPVATLPARVDLSVAGDRIGAVSATGPGRCTGSPDGSWDLSAGQDENLRTGTGVPLVTQLRFTAAGRFTALSIGVGERWAGSGKGWDLTDATARFEPGWQPQRATFFFAGVVPLTSDGQPDPSEAWSGSVSWDCRSG